MNGTEMTVETVEATEVVEAAKEVESSEDALSQSARLFTAADVEERLRAARGEWEAERASEMESARAAAFADGEIAAAAAHAAELRALEDALEEARTAASRRDTEIRCARYLRERSLDESMAEILLSPAEVDVADEVLMARVAALSGAVEAAAIRALREKTESVLPGGASGSVTLTGKIIRETPVSRLAEMMG